MNTNFIKILDEETANKLKASGFSYMKERSNNKEIFIFAATQELMKVLSSQFSNPVFVCESKLRF